MCMQQYFSDIDFKENDEVLLDADTLYHLKKVLRKDENYTFRLVNKNHEIYKGHLTSNNTFLAIEKLNENNELDVDITCVLALIKSDKFELCIQKLVELGVKRIVPYNAYRSVMKIKKDSKYNKLKLSELIEKPKWTIVDAYAEKTLIINYVPTGTVTAPSINLTSTTKTFISSVSGITLTKGNKSVSASYTPAGSISGTQTIAAHTHTVQTTTSNFTGTVSVNVQSA